MATHPQDNPGDTPAETPVPMNDPGEPTTPDELPVIAPDQDSPDAGPDEMTLTS